MKLVVNIDLYNAIFKTPFYYRNFLKCLYSIVIYRHNNKIELSCYAISLTYIDISYRIFIVIGCFVTLSLRIY